MSRLLSRLVLLHLLIPASLCFADSMTAQASGRSKEAACASAKELAQPSARNICGAKGLAEWKFQDCVCKEQPGEADKNGSSSPSRWDCEAGYDYTCGQ